jgi:2-polyprenyl-6-methoxyphenol hydroxylase-like FAD-dependent oxidoreductase
LEASDYCTLRSGCTVVGRTSETPPIVEYDDVQGIRHQIKGQWLIGADGKMGIVRKYFLEPSAGIKQVDGLYPYTGTWIAANLHMTLPTPASHPDFPLWKLGYSPEDVYDLFWPVGWHFCSPPGKPTACGRFGPHKDRLWRHEFLHQAGSDDDAQSEMLFWEHITPMITRQSDAARGIVFAESVRYPRDCIEILRCRPFRFVQKVVNQWYHKRTILIGDAAHVYPPFAGQGIASGLRDAHQLSWRLALLLNSYPTTADREERILSTWALERRSCVDNAAKMSRLSGDLVNKQPNFLVFALITMHAICKSIPYFPADVAAATERMGFSKVNGGFFLRDYNGGIKLAQIHVQSSARPQGSMLSDCLVKPTKSSFTLLILDKGRNLGQKYQDAKNAVLAAGLDPTVLSTDSIVAYDILETQPVTNLAEADTLSKSSQLATYSPAPHSGIQGRLVPGYDKRSYTDRFGYDWFGNPKSFAIIRPDLFIFACTRNVSELRKCLAKLRGMT